MTIKRCKENVILVELPKEPDTREELEKTVRTIYTNPVSDVLIDFSNIDIVRSPTICGLLRLRRSILEANHRLVLCNVSPLTMGIFEKTGLDTVFEFADNTAVALESVLSAD